MGLLSSTALGLLAALQLARAPAPTAAAPASTVPTAPAPPGSSQVERGRYLFHAKACFTCHRTDSRVLVGPPLNQLYGGRVLLKSGRVVTVDDDYLRESMIHPGVAVVAGFEQHMIQIDLQPQDVNDLVAFIKSLGRMPPTPEPKPGANPFTEHGRVVFESSGCVACHGVLGSMPVPDPGATIVNVPELRTLAERMMLDGPSDVKAAVGVLEHGVPDQAPAKPPFAAYPRFAAQARAVHQKIANGSRPAAAGLAQPPLSMPAWKAELSDRDIDAVIAWLITLQPWDE